MIWISSHTHAHRQYACIKVPVNNSPRVKWNIHFRLFSPETNVEPQGVRDPCSSAEVSSAMVTTNWRVQGLWEVSGSEGAAGLSLLRSRRLQRASLGTAVYRVVRWFTLVIIKIPSSAQFAWGNSGILPTTTQFQCSSDSSSDICQVGMTQAVAIPGAVRECPIIPTNCSCTKTRKVSSRPKSVLFQ